MGSEETFSEILEWGDKHTGGNAAFSWEYGEHSLNALRAILGLAPLTAQDACRTPRCHGRAAPGIRCTDCNAVQPARGEEG